MPDLLIRNLDDDLKRALMSRAKEQGRSQQAEAKAILAKALREDPKSWVARLMHTAQTVGGVDIEAPQRHMPREPFGPDVWS